MAYAIPNLADASNADQAELDSVDIDILVQGLQGDGVVSGCAVTAQGTPDMTVAVAGGTIRISGTAATVTAGNVTITAANASFARFDLVVSNSTGVLSATAGVAAANPVFPEVPASSVALAAVHVPAADTTISSGQIIDKRVVIIANSSGIDHGGLSGLGDDDHTQYRLESADHTHQSTGLQAGQIDHGLAITGLGDDDHTQYLKEEASGGLASEVPDHTHASAAEAGTVSHGVLTSVTADQHHTQLHAAAHAEGGADEVIDGVSVPSTQAFSDAAAVGVDTTKAAPRLHVHGMPANPVTAHEAAADPHTGYRLESADHSHASAGLQGGTVAHTALTGVTADQHHAQSHAHSAAGDGTALAPATVEATTHVRVGGHARVGSVAAPTNVTAGDLTAVRLKVGDGAFGTGVELSVTGDGAFSGFLRVGSETAPTNTTAGDLTAVRLHVGTEGAFTSGVGLETTAVRLSFGGSVAGVLLTVGATISTPTDSNGIQALIDGSITGAGDNPAGFHVNTTFTPSASIGSAYGQRFLPTFAPDTGVTITNAIGSQVIPFTGTLAGAITNFYGIYIAPIYQTTKPTNSFGINIEDMGSTGITTAIGLQIKKPTAATNNFYISFDAADATAAGTYFGRLPIRYAGALKFLHVFNA